MYNGFFFYAPRSERMAETEETETRKVQDLMQPPAMSEAEKKTQSHPKKDHQDPMDQLDAKDHVDLTENVVNQDSQETVELSVRKEKSDQPDLLENQDVMELM